MAVFFLLFGANVERFTPSHTDRGVLFFDRFLCFFVSLLARLLESGLTDLHEIFREGVE